MKRHVETFSLPFFVLTLARSVDRKKMVVRESTNEPTDSPRVQGMSASERTTALSGGRHCMGDPKTIGGMISRRTVRG